MTKLGQGADGVADVAVLGGGLVGLLTAWRIGEAGAKVVLLDAGAPGGEASSAAAGVLSAQAEFDADSDLFRFSLLAERGYKAALDALCAPPSVGYGSSGLIYLATGEAQAYALQRRGQWQNALGLNAAWRADAGSCELPLGAEVTGGLWLPDAQWLNPRLLVAAALERAAAHAEVRANTAATHIEVAGQGGFIVHSGRGPLRAAKLVLAAGAWSSRLPILRDGEDVRATLGLAEPAIEPVRGVLLELELRGRELSHVLYWKGGYLAPRADGRAVLGASSEPGGFDKAVTEEALFGIKARAFRVLPWLEQCPVLAQWSGLRPFARRERPLIGETALGGLFVATGHYRNGILQAPLTAQTLATLLLTGQAPEWLSLFAPA